MEHQESPSDGKLASTSQTVGNQLSVCHSRKSDEWATPSDKFTQWDQEFGPFTLDAAATDENALCPRYFTMKDDGLAQPWTGTVWVNPPYSQIAKWVEKAFRESLAGATVVMLVPSRTDTRWWHSYAVHAEVRFVKGRLRFGGAKSSAPFPSALLVFRPPSTGTSTQDLLEALSGRSTAS